MGAVLVGVEQRQAVTSGFAIQIAGFATIALAIELGGTVGQSGVPLGAVLLGLGVAVSSSQQVSILQTWAEVIHDRQGRCARGKRLSASRRR